MQNKTKAKIKKLLVPKSLVIFPAMIAEATIVKMNRIPEPIADMYSRMVFSGFIEISL
jgi:hypothetical protein